MAMKEPGACLSEAFILAFVDGKLSPEHIAELEGHIAGCATCRAAVEGAAAGAASVISTMPLAKAPSMPADGDLVGGKYRVKKLIGRGGMGAVLGAEHVELGSSVAIKVSFQQEQSSQARFLREAKLAAQLSNDNIARVHDVGRLPDGAPYLVMEYLHGEDLGAVVERGPVPVEVAVSWVLQACAGVREAHAKGIVHRDLKPKNLFLTTRTDGTQIVKVLDFGVSKLLRRDIDALDVSLTTTEMLVGSPAYMSPEQLRDSKDVDARADIWSLGVILHQLVTGKLPFPARSLSALILAVADETPPAPSTLVPGLPPHIDACVAKCLAKAREDRFQTVSELMAALGGTGGAAKVPRRSRAPYLFLALSAVLAAGAALAYGLHPRDRASQEPPARPGPPPAEITAREAVATSTATTSPSAAPAATQSTTAPSASVAKAPPAATAAPRASHAGVRPPAASAPSASGGKHLPIKPIDPTATPE